MNWGEKRYHSLDYYLKHTFGEKIYKVSLNASMTCPNRDGLIDTRGCIFCSAGGSGEFAADRALSITEQITTASAAMKQRKSIGNHYIAYFQSYTNTYAPVERLAQIYAEALSHPFVTALSIGTRPDCFSEEIFSLLSQLSEKTWAYTDSDGVLVYKKKPVWIELGLQTIHETTARFIRRGYPLSVYEDTVTELKKRNIPVITHVILGLPGEDKTDILATIDYLNHIGTDGIKLHLLHVLKGTDLAGHLGTFPIYTMEEYTDLVITCLEHLSPEIVIHRLTGDGPKDLLLAPLWSTRKREVLNMIHRKMKERDTWQGKRKENP